MAFGGSRIIPTRAIRSQRTALTSSTTLESPVKFAMADDDKPKQKEPELEGWARLQAQLAEAEKKGNKPPIYEVNKNQNVTDDETTSLIITLTFIIYTTYLHM